MSIFGHNPNVECQVTERSLHSECRNTLKAFCVAQWTTQANERTVTIHGHIMTLEILSSTTSEILSELLLTLVTLLVFLSLTKHSSRAL